MINKYGLCHYYFLKIQFNKCVNLQQVFDDEDDDDDDDDDVDGNQVFGITTIFNMNEKVISL